MAFIEESTCELVTDLIPVVDKWKGKPVMLHTAARDMADHTHTDNHERYHVRFLDWKWIGYSYSIEKDGRIFFSRPTAEEQQYHCKGDGQNSKSLGIVLCGDGTESPMTEEQYASVLKIMHAYCSSSVLVHRDYSDSACPGDVLMEDINRRFGKLVVRK